MSMPFRKNPVQNRRRLRVAALMNPIHTLDELEVALSRPTQGGLDTLRALEGDVMVLGAGGKMGPTLVRMARRGLDAIGQGDANARAIQCLAHAASPPLALIVGTRASFHGQGRRDGLALESDALV